MRAIVRTLLGRDGVEADIAEDGQRATAMLAEREYSAVVLDLLMPRLDGRGVIDFMRERGLNVPVIVLSAVQEAEDLDPVFVRVVMQKPFEVRELKRVVNAVLEKM
ncbi:MAG TPA: response regulator [Thermoanaerobaculia bacterium]|nr:response regulator [Thermoanaerobaculia bacterium]